VPRKRPSTVTPRAAP